MITEPPSPLESTLDSNEARKLGSARSDPHPSYLSVRVTCAHIDMKRMLERIFSGFKYICYPHKGSKTNKEHVHVLIPDPENNTGKNIKDRLTRAGYKGNESFSVKGMKNGILQGIQYASRENTDPIVEGGLGHLIEMAPEWQHRQTNMHKYYAVEDDDEKKSRKVRDWQLTYSNLVPQAVMYYKKHKLDTTSLKNVVKHMMHHTKWKPSVAMIKGGVPQFYQEDFEVRIGHRTEYEMDWFCTRG